MWTYYQELKATLEILRYWLCLSCVFISLSLNAQILPILKVQPLDYNPILMELSQNSMKARLIFQDLNKDLKTLKYQLQTVSVQLTESQADLQKEKASKVEILSLLNNSKTDFQVYKTGAELEMSSLKRQKVLLEIGLAVVSGLLVYKMVK